MEHLTATQFAADRIRESILSGDLKPGDRLQQHALAALYGVSHVPLREALRGLESEGFISISPRRGAFVQPLTREDAQDIFELRALTECRAMLLSGPNLKAGQIAVLREICEEADGIEELTESIEGEGRLALLNEWHDVNARFHRVLYSECDRPRLLALIETLWKNTSRYVMLLRHRGGYFGVSQAEHWKMVEAVSDGRTEDAVKLIHEHILGAAERTISLLPR
ncbi:GntR family transcriptional regulator [Trinickia sp.]|uniref:GntR family transcriptional regulator n=1 Tax=Trinickia sp. TaxID=2571163 RepID=UPI003F81ADCF